MFSVLCFYFGPSLTEGGFFGVFAFLNDYLLIGFTVMIAFLILLPFLVRVLAPFLIGVLEIPRMILKGLQYFIGELAEYALQQFK